MLYLSHLKGACLFGIMIHFKPFFFLPAFFPWRQIPCESFKSWKCVAPEDTKCTWDNWLNQRRAWIQLWGRTLVQIYWLKTLQAFHSLAFSKKQGLQKHVESKKEAQGNCRCADSPEKHKTIPKGFQWCMWFFFHPSLTEMIKWLKAEIKGQNIQTGTGKKATDYSKK